MKQLRKFLKIKEGEGKPTILLFAYFFFFGATLTVGKTARDTYFLNRYNIDYLPLMFLLAACAVAIIAFVNYLVANRLDLVRNLFRTIFLSGSFFAISLIFIQNHLKDLMIPFLYVWIDVITVVINFQLVIFVSMLFNSRQAKRLFGIILCGSPIARITIGSCIPPFVGQFGSSSLLILTAVFILCCVLIAWIASSYIQHMPRIKQAQYKESKSTGFLPDYLKMLALAIGAAAVATVIIEYQFLIFSNHAFQSEEKLAGFFGTFYSIAGIVSLFTQLLLTRWMLARFGILTTMRILPAGLGLGALAVLFNPSLLSTLIGRASEQITKFTLHKTSLDLLWVPVSPEQKQRKKLLIDDTVKTGMQGITGILIYTFIEVCPLSYTVLMQVLSMVALLSIGIWFYTTSYLKKGYVSALTSAIEKRQLNFEEMRLDTTDGEIVKTIDDALNSEEEAKQIFALELISDLYLSPWKDSLRRLFKKGSHHVQAKIISMTVDRPDIISDDDIRHTINEKGPLTGNALIIAGKRNMMEMIPTVRYILENTQDEDPEIYAAAAIAVLMLSNGPSDLAQSILESLLKNEDEDLKTIALKMLRNNPDLLTDSQLQECCENDSVEVCSAALDIARIRYHAGLIPYIINCLKHPQTRSVVRKTLESYPPVDVVDILTEKLTQDKIDARLKIEIIRTLKDYPDPKSISILVRMLRYPSIDIKGETIDALLKIARQAPFSVDVLHQLSDENKNIARHIYSLYEMMESITQGKDGLLINDLYTAEAEQYIQMLFKLLVLPVPEIPIETYLTNERNEYNVRTDNLIEIFDNILPHGESGYVIPLLKDISIDERSRIGRRYFTDLPNDLDIELIRLIQSSNEYHSAIGLDYAISHCRTRILEQIDWTIFTEQRVHYEIIAKYVAMKNDVLLSLPEFPVEHFLKLPEGKSMLSILEKTIILKGTNLFKGVPGESIFHVAQVMEEERLEKGSVLFQKGDKGNYFYIVITGEILIHIDEIEFNRHGKGEYFGEMALLDDSPRSSSATALDETLLLKISQENFLDIMMAHKEVRRNIMGILSERFRRLTEQYAGAIPKK